MQAAFKKRFLLFSIIISVGYFLVSFYFTNPSLINQTILGNFSLSYKYQLIWELFLGLGMALGEVKLWLLLIVSVLTGVNLALLLDRIIPLKNPVSNLAVGGSILGFGSSSCMACGVPVLGVLGVSGSLTRLPFKGLEISLVAIGLLIFSLFFLLKKYSNSCKLDSRYGI